MEIKVLLYVSEDDPDTWILKALRGAGISVNTVKNLSRLHNLLASRFFDAVVIHRNMLADHGVTPSRHLWEAHIPVNIIAYTVNEIKKLNTTVFCVPKNITGYCSAKSGAERLKTVNSILLSLKNGNTTPSPDNLLLKNTEKPTEQVLPIIFEEAFLRTLHKKMRSILETLVQAGREGVDPDEISLAVWKNTVHDRKKDIQIYISRLRTITKRNFTGRYRIELLKKRYVLFDARSS